MDELVFGWWNTSLIPIAKSSNSDELRKFCIQIIGAHLLENNIDFLALGEVSENEVERLNAIFDRTKYTILSGILKAEGRADFDFCFIYDSSKLKIVDGPISLINKNHGDTADDKVGVYLKLVKQVDLAEEIPNNVNQSLFDREFHLFISHWPSLLHTSKAKGSRTKISGALRDEIDQIINGSFVVGQIPNIISMGDFNNEPFDVEIEENLKASRDKELVSIKKRRLYNPFWRVLGFDDIQEPYKCGTYYYINSEINSRWLTFDQIIISSSLIGGNDGKWELVDDGNFVFKPPFLQELILNRNSKIDHLPIFCKFRKKNVS